MKQRLISAAVLLPIVLASIISGGWLYGIFIGVAFLAAGWEYVQMLRRIQYQIPISMVWLVESLWIADALWGQGQWIAPGMALMMLLTSAWSLIRRRQNPNSFAPTACWALALAGGTYLGIGGAYLLRLRALPQGLWWTMTALPVVWLADTGAYLAGVRWGQHKIAPSISPGKSWEGYGGELGGGVLSGALFGLLWPWVAGQPLDLTASKGALLGLWLAALTPFGDFFVSMIKREAGVKDTGKLIPGHGGALDRLDSLIWAGILTWGFVILFGG